VVKQTPMIDKSPYLSISHKDNARAGELQALNGKIWEAFVWVTSHLMLLSINSQGGWLLRSSRIVNQQLQSQNQNTLRCVSFA